jgi:hypothetical protein
MNIWSMVLPTAGLVLAVILLTASLRTITPKHWERKDIRDARETLGTLADVFGSEAVALGPRLPDAQRIVTLRTGDADEAGEEAGYDTASGNRIIWH